MDKTLKVLLISLFILSSLSVALVVFVERPPERSTCGEIHDAHQEHVIDDVCHHGGE